MMIDHVTANVGDFEQAKHFYAQALAPLGYSVQVEFEGAAGFGTGEGIPDFWIGSTPERGASHVAFSASDRAKVDAFYEAAMAARVAAARQPRRRGSSSARGDASLRHRLHVRRHRPPRQPHSGSVARSRRWRPGDTDPLRSLRNGVHYTVTASLSAPINPGHATVLRAVPFAIP
jgi:catechol 2,3-dioxygenase-like lactoylglutathione lyase family enzyme